MSSPPKHKTEPVAPSPPASQHQAPKSRSPNPEAASFVPREAQPQPSSYPLGVSQLMQAAHTAQSAISPSSSQPNARQDSATARVHAPVPTPVAPNPVAAKMEPIAPPFFMPNPFNAVLESSGISTSILCDRLQAVERTMLRVEKAVGQQNTGMKNTTSWAGAVRTEDRLMDLERAVIGLGSTLREVERILEDTIASNREDLKTDIAVAVGTVLDYVDTLHNEEKARLQERGDRYARQNRMLREQLRCKTARVKENTCRNAAAMADDSSSAPSPILKTRIPSVPRDSAVDTADESAESVEPAAITVGLHTVDELARQVDKTTLLGQKKELGFDLGFLDSIDTSKASDMRYLHHFMAQDQGDGAPTEVDRDSHSSSSEAGFAYHVSAAPPFSSRPPEILKTGLDVSRGTFSSVCTAPKLAAMAPTLAPPQPVTWDESIHWVEPGPFASLAERQESWSDEWLDFRNAVKPVILLEGLRYQPGVYTPDIYRTVVVSNIPVTISAGTLLHQVRGGSVYSVSMMDTSNILGSFSALVTFTLESSAVSFVQMAAVKPVAFAGQQAKVRLVKTPTYPMNPVLERGIFERGYTRVFVVKSVQNPVLIEGILKDLEAVQMAEILVGWSAKDGDLAISFTSVAAANRGYEFISQSPVHKELDLHWGNDPCDNQ